MHPPYLVRQATAADIAAMSRIRLGVTENALSDPGRITEGMYLDYLERRGRGWVAEVEGAVVGFCHAAANGSIWALFMLPAFEGRGIARALLQHAVDWLFARGHAHIRLGTEPHTRADRFYAAQGWIRGELRDGEVGYTLPRPATP